MRKDGRIDFMKDFGELENFYEELSRFGMDTNKNLRRITPHKSM